MTPQRLELIARLLSPVVTDSIRPVSGLQQYGRSRQVTRDEANELLDMTVRQIWEAIHGRPSRPAPRNPADNTLRWMCPECGRKQATKKAALNHSKDCAGRRPIRITEANQ